MQSKASKIHKYHKWIEWDESDQVFIGRCPDLISGIHGSDPVKLYEELCSVVEEVVEHYESSGRPLPEPRTKPMMEI